MKKKVVRADDLFLDFRFAISDCPIVIHPLTWSERMNARCAMRDFRPYPVIARAKPEAIQSEGWAMGNVETHSNCTPPIKPSSLNRLWWRGIFLTQKRKENAKGAKSKHLIINSLRTLRKIFAPLRLIFLTYKTASRGVRKKEAVLIRQPFSFPVKRANFMFQYFSLVIRLGLEPRTPSLKGMCSTC